jgi:glyoxylase-like metal-dependent hydrolase (beta-lactamase superfamily II)
MRPLCKIGKFEILLHNHGCFKLDGGAMFGVVPRPLWEKKIVPDARGRIRMSTVSLLIRDHQRCILVDTGCGDKWDEKLRDRYAIEAPIPLACAEQVTDVILTHLHFDHAGGLSYRAADGTLRACYPNARVHVQAQNLALARNPNLREQSSYLQENLAILDTLPLNLLHGSCELFPGLQLHLAHGHTRGQQWLEISDARECLVFPTDLVPTSHHLPLAWHMGFDMCVEALLHEKAALIERALVRHAWVVFQHDPDVAAARILRNSKGVIELMDCVALNSI